MTVPVPSKTTGIQIEITPKSMKVLAGSDGLDLPLDRSDRGLLTPECKARVIAALKTFVEKLGARARQRTVCALDARGALVRVLDLPAVSGQEFERLLMLQIEREFPLSPTQMAWGAHKARLVAPRNGSPGAQQVVVVAAKKELLEEYRQLLQACGLQTKFTLAAIARAALAPSTDQTFGVLNISEPPWEFIAFEHGAPKALRNITTKSANQRAPRPLAETIGSGSGTPENGNSTSPASATLKTAINGELTGGTIYVTSETSPPAETAAGIQALLPSARCETLSFPAGPGRSAATLGLATLAEQDRDPMIGLDMERRVETQKPAARPTRAWAISAAALLVLCILARYAEPLIQGPRLRKRLVELKQYRDSLPNVDRDLAFLQFIQTNQPKYLEVMAVMAEAAPSGTRIESLSLKRNGDFSLRGSMRDGAQVGEFRSKLIKSEAFASVVVEEQAPTPDRQKVSIRIAGDWKPAAEPKAISSATGASAKTSSRRETTVAPASGATNGTPAQAPGKNASATNS